MTDIEKKPWAAPNRDTSKDGLAAFAIAMLTVALIALIIYEII